MSVPSKFDLWVQYEKIAMHFNDLLIQLRLRALAGIGVIGTLTGVLAKQPEQFNWTLMAFVSFFLFCIWIAIFIVDKFYYARLLSGAVKALIELEKEALVDGFKIKMSTHIERSVFKNKKPSDMIFAVLWFYGIVAVLLLSVLYMSLNHLGIIDYSKCGL